jgi:hypothetical protein
MTSDSQQEPRLPRVALRIQGREWRLKAHSLFPCPAFRSVLTGAPLDVGSNLLAREEWLIGQAAEWGHSRGMERSEARATAAAFEELEACRQFLEGLNQHHLAERLMEARRPVEPDRSEAADAARLRWILNGNGYFLEEYGLCGHGPGEEDEARREIDKRMAREQADPRDPQEPLAKL